VEKEAEFERDDNLQCLVAGVPYPRMLPAAFLTDPSHLQLKGLAILLVHLVQPVTGTETPTHIDSV
jgi:hypothetical protein